MNGCTWYDRLADSLLRYVGEDIMKEVMAGHDGLTDLKDKAEWTTQAMDRLERLVPDRHLRKQIMLRCSCPCPGDHLQTFRELYKRSGDLDAFLEAAHGKLFLNKPTRDGKTVFITKVARHPEEFATAQTPEDKLLYFCHCDNVRASRSNVSDTYCYCGAGWAKQIFEAVLGHPVDVEIEKSVLRGDDTCVIAVHT